MLILLLANAAHLLEGPVPGTPLPSDGIMHILAIGAGLFSAGGAWTAIRYTTRRSKADMAEMKAQSKKDSDKISDKFDEITHTLSSVSATLLVNAEAHRSILDRMERRDDQLDADLARGVVRMDKLESKIELVSTQQAQIHSQIAGHLRASS